MIPFKTENQKHTHITNQTQHLSKNTIMVNKYFNIKKKKCNNLSYNILLCKAMLLHNLYCVSTHNKAKNLGLISLAYFILQ